MKKFKKIVKKTVSIAERAGTLGASLVLAVAIVYNSVFIYGKKKEKTRDRTR